MLQLLDLHVAVLINKPAACSSLQGFIMHCTVHVLKSAILPRYGLAACDSLGNSSGVEQLLKRFLGFFRRA